MKRLFLLFLSFGLIHCKKHTAENLGEPEILSFMQHIDTTGATVIIVGKNFSKTPSNNIVSFNGVDTTAFFSSSDTSGDTLQVNVPSKATTGLIAVTVYNKIAFSADTFYVGTGRWKRMADFPGGARSGALGFSIGNKGYITGGSGTQNYNDLWEYDMSSDQWTKKADFPGLPLTGAVCFVLGGKAYIGCGQSNVFPYTSQAFYAYDPTANAWTQMKDINLPAETNLKPLGFVVDGLGYLVANTGTNKVFAYDPSVDQWTQKGDFPGGGRDDAAGFTIGEKGYLVGGSAESFGVIEGDCWEYDPAADQWNQKTGSAPVYDAVGFSINGNGYVGNGRFSQRLFLAYDPVADRWSYKAPFPGLASGDAVSFAVNDTAFVALGLYSNTITDEVWRFVP